jgi:hypothetical protein
MKKIEIIGNMMTLSNKIIKKTKNIKIKILITIIIRTEEVDHQIIKMKENIHIIRDILKIQEENKININQNIKTNTKAGMYLKKKY